MNLLKLLMLTLLAAAVSATTAPTLGKVLGFGHSVAYAGQGDQGDDNDDQGDDNDNQ